MNKILLGKISKDSARLLVHSCGGRMPRNNREALVSRAIRDHRPSESVANVNGKYYHYEYERVTV